MPAPDVEAVRHVLAQRRHQEAERDEQRAETGGEHHDQGHGARARLDRAVEQQHGHDAGADDQQPRDDAGQEEVEDVAARPAPPSNSDEIQSRKPPMRNAGAPPTLSQSGVLNLLKSMGCPSVAGALRAIDRTPVIRGAVADTVAPRAHRVALRVRQDGRRRSRPWPQRTGLAARLQRRHGSRDRRRRADRHRRRRPHRGARDPRAPGRHVAPEGARRDPRRHRPTTSTSPTSPPTTSGRSISSSSTCIRSRPTRRSS